MFHDNILKFTFVSLLILSEIVLGSTSTNHTYYESELFY